MNPVVAPVPLPDARPARLDGWKEIAAYIGRGVRTAQRWEKALGMPVRRQVTGSADTPYAVPDEIDAWRLTVSKLPKSDSYGVDKAAPLGQSEPSDNGDPRSNLTAAPSAPPHAVFGGVRHWTRIAVLFLAVGGLISGAVYVWLPWIRTVNPHAIKAAGNTMTVFGPKGQELWAKSFDFPLTDLSSPVTLERQSRIVDIDGDGRNEILVSLTAPENSGLFVFGPRGSLLFHDRVNRTVRFGSEAYGPSWVADRLYVPQRPGSVLASYHVWEEFAAVIRETDVGGRLLGEYWSNGYVTGVARLPVNGSMVTFVGAAHNETGGASLAIFTRGLGGSAPARTEKYRCTDCPPGHPDVFLVFPRARVAARASFNASVISIAPVGPDRFSIRVLPGFSEDSLESVYYHVDASGHVLRAELGAGIRAYEDKRVREGTMSEEHRYRDPDDLWPVLRWNGTDFDAITGPER